MRSTRVGVLQLHACANQRLASTYSIKWYVFFARTAKLEICNCGYLFPRRLREGCYADFDWVPLPAVLLFYRFWDPYHMRIVYGIYLKNLLWPLSSHVLSTAAATSASTPNPNPSHIEPVYSNASRTVKPYRPMGWAWAYEKKQKLTSTESFYSAIETFDSLIHIS